jgi:SNF2 family DNA or RNA helicase
VTLTGTPVENRLSELWSIMEFCNPGYLSTSGEFRRRFAIPIERRRDAHRAEVLRDLVRPFVLRRLKVDPEVIDDLPPCVQTREYANLTPVQARLYQDTVNAMLDQVGRSDGIQRRGLVLSTLVKLKQICDHPDLLRDKDEPRDAATGDLVALSGKSARITQMLEQVCATNERALIFTQFRRMGHLLTAMLQHELDEDVLFLHGGTTPAKRQALIDRFQDPASDARIFVLSLKAGGVGLNLTAATHVFHYDRWWNPAVENQATDRAFRIGQTRTVHVHKFVCLGTLEERIDQMIEQKTELAEQIIGSGEQWLTELSTGQLRDLLTLRRDATDVLETRS